MPVAVHVYVPTTLHPADVLSVYSEPCLSTGVPATLPLTVAVGDFALPSYAIVFGESEMLARFAFAIVTLVVQT